MLIVASTPPPPQIDLLSATAADLQSLLDSGAVTSEHLVRLYLAQIEKHNHYGLRLNAIISVAPRDGILARARDLDRERRAGGKRGPLHGIPVVVKDLTLTPSLDMPTTGGSWALVGVRAKQDSAVVGRLLEAGVLVIGKANLAQWGSLKGQPPAGWSAVGGQVQCPYVRGGQRHDDVDRVMGHSNTAGSSSGSAVAVAAGFVPLALGEDSEGSITWPATRQALYSLKPTPGTVPCEHGFNLAVPFTSAGPMAKSTRDVASLAGALMRRDFSRDVNAGLHQGCEALRIGVVNLDEWRPAGRLVRRDHVYDDLEASVINDALDQLEEKGAKVVRDIHVIDMSTLTQGTGIDSTGDLYECLVRPGFEEFFAEFDDPPVRSIDELIAWNVKNAHLELPPEHPRQAILNKLAGKEVLLPDETFRKALGRVRERARRTHAAAMERYGIDVILTSGDTSFVTASAMAGYPMATMPLGAAEGKGLNGRRIGVGAVAETEETLIRVMASWEREFGHGREVPKMLKNWDAWINGEVDVLC